MSRYFDELERQLREQTTKRYSTGSGGGPASAQPRRSGRATFVLRHRRLLVGAAAALAGLAVPALGAVNDLWHPDVKPAPAMRTVNGTGFACRQASGHGADAEPRVGRAFTSVLDVLARPRTTADVPERRYLQTPFARDIDTQGIRYLGTAPDGRRYYVLPAGGSGAPQPPADCRRRYARQPRRELTVCVVGGGAGSCGSLADVRLHGSWGADGAGSHSTVAGVVPNGVRAIRVTYGRSTRAFAVEDNFFAFRVDLEAPQAAHPDRLVWELDDGSVRDVTRRATVRPKAR